MGCWNHSDRWQNKMERMQYKMERMRDRMESRGFGFRGFGPPSSGNRAFDEYRMETLRRLEEEQASGLPRDGRSNIYTGETYSEARLRWEGYRDLLLDHLRGPGGVWH